MASAPAKVGDDAFGPFENRSPIGVGHFGDENASLFEFAEFARALDAAHFCRGDGFANAEAGEKAFAFFLEPISGK